jgi:hypothetical protein
LYGHEESVGIELNGANYLLGGEDDIQIRIPLPATMEEWQKEAHGWKTKMKRDRDMR